MKPTTLTEHSHHKIRMPSDALKTEELRRRLKEAEAAGLSVAAGKLRGALKTRKAAP